MRENEELDDGQALDLLARVGGGHRWLHVEKLQEFDGEPALAGAEGED